MTQRSATLNSTIFDIGYPNIIYTVEMRKKKESRRPELWESSTIEGPLMKHLNN